MTGILKKIMVGLMGLTAGLELGYGFGVWLEFQRHPVWSTPWYLALIPSYLVTGAALLAELALYLCLRGREKRAPGQ